jgi:hypothetical protein
MHRPLSRALIARFSIRHQTESNEYADIVGFVTAKEGQPRQLRIKIDEQRSGLTLASDCSAIDQAVSQWHTRSGTALRKHCRFVGWPWRKRHPSGLAMHRDRPAPDE